jgi:hypothetical protein
MCSQLLSAIWSILWSVPACVVASGIDAIASAANIVRMLFFIGFVSMLMLLGTRTAVTTRRRCCTPRLCHVGIQFPDWYGVTTMPFRFLRRRRLEGQP